MERRPGQLKAGYRGSTQKRLKDLLRVGVGEQPKLLNLSEVLNPLHAGEAPEVLRPQAAANSDDVARIFRLNV